jgi:DNA-binding GntR family transcriptional regulator
MADTKSLKDRIYDNVLEDILQGNYPANAVINERMLIEKYDVSKTPIREALVQLCNEGMLKNLPRFGYQLTPITPKEILDIMELRLLLELGALEKTMGVITDLQIAQLEANVVRARALAAEKNVKTHWFHNITFHLLLCSFCQNDFIYESLERTLHFCSRGAGQYFKKAWSEKKTSDGTEHGILIGALRERDLPLARETLARDIGSMKSEILDA